MGGIEKYKTSSFEDDDEYDRQKEVKEFDESKIGVKGLVDSGIKTLPRMFIRPPDELLQDSQTPGVKRQVPVIDLQSVGKKENYDEIVRQVVNASENWGFFQVINHGIPVQVLDKMLERMKMFFEQDEEAKKEFYTRDLSKQLVYTSNFDLYTSQTANWKDSLFVNVMHSGILDPEALPQFCRDIIQEYSNHLLKLSDMLLELLSVGLGLEPDHLKKLECTKGWNLANHYYPACPAPELTLGSSQHTDATLITILLQDLIGGLQVRHENQWVDIKPTRGALVVNIGDILQMVSNDKFKSVLHRVTVNHVRPRNSVAFFLKGIFSSQKLYGPIKELLSDENPPLYKEFTLSEFHTNFYSKPLYMSGIDKFKIRNLGDLKENTSNACRCYFKV